MAGIGETPYYRWGESPDPEFKLAIKAILTACDDAGIDPASIDGFASYSNDRNEPSRLAAALGIPDLKFSSFLPQLSLPVSAEEYALAGIDELERSYASSVAVPDPLALLTFQWLYPGKKLLFMGGEFGQPWEWNHHESLPWHLLEQASHAAITRLVADLNALYRQHDALKHDSDGDDFYWLSWEDYENSVLSFARCHNDEHLFIVLNFTPVPRDDYRIGVPFEGQYREILNSDSEYYGGSNFGNGGLLVTESAQHMGQPCSLRLSIPPLGGIVLARA